MKHKQGFQKTYLWLKLFGGIFVLVGCCCQTMSRHYIKKDYVKQSIAFPGSCFISPCFCAPPLF